MKQRALILLSALFFSGCVRFQPQPISAVSRAENLETRSLTNAAIHSFLEKNLQRELSDWPKSEWNFEMLTLAAFYCHPDLALARAQWGVARGGVVTAGGRPNPTLSLVPGYNTTHSIPSPWLPAVSFDLPLETAGKRSHRIEAAEQLSESARLNIATVAWQVRSNLRLSLIDFLAAQRRLELLTNLVSLQTQVVQRLDQQVQAGAIAHSESTPSRVMFQKSQLDLSDAERQCAETRTRLAQSLGVPSNALDAIQLSSNLFQNVETSAELTTDDVRRAALLSRADILGALADYAASEAALQTEIAKQYPDVHLNPGYQFDQGDNKWSLGITFDLPILNQNQGPIAEAKARRTEAAAKFDSTQAKALGEIERATAIYRISKKNSVTLRALAETQTAQRDSMKAQFQAGAVEPLEWLNAQVEFAGAELLQLDAETKLQQATADLESVVQRPLKFMSAVLPVSSVQAKSEKP